MLLTSAQVSLAISSSIGSFFPSIPQTLLMQDIVFLFTTALFLSGYVLQQQTVRDLRAAIKPQLERPPPGPDLYLPPQFTEDGYLVDAVTVETQDIQVEEKADVAINNGNKSTVEDVSAEEKGEGETHDESDMVGATRWQKAARKKKIEEARKAAQGPQNPLNEPDYRSSSREEPTVKPKPEEKPMSRAERRRKIKEEILAAGEGEGFKGYRRRTW